MNHEDKIRYYDALPYDQDVVSKVIKGILQNKIVKVRSHTPRDCLHYLSYVKLSLLISEMHVDIVELDASNSGGGDPLYYSSPGIFSAGECYRICHEAKAIFEKRDELERAAREAERAVECNQLKERLLSEL